MICAAPAQLTPAFGHLGKAQPAPAKRKNCWFPLQYLCLGTQGCLKPWQWHLGDLLLRTRRSINPPTPVCPMAEQRWRAARQSSAGTCPWEQVRVPWCRHGADLPHGSGCLCVLRGWFPGRNNSSGPQGLLTGSSCCCFLKITIVGGLCSFSFFLNSIFSVMLQLLKWSFP